MLKETIKYEDFEGEEQTETLWLNITKTDSVNLLTLIPRMEAWEKQTSGPARELTAEEIIEMVAIVKELVHAAYGVRSEDGKLHRKSPDLLADFQASAVYDAFIMSMFEDPNKANNFMAGIMPKSLRAEMERAIAEAGGQESVEVIDGRITNVEKLPVVGTGELNHTEEEVPAWIREDREPTPAELKSMSREQMMEAMARKSKRRAAEADSTGE